MAEGEKQYRRLYPRRKALVPCQLTWQENQAFGNTSDVSLGGLAIVLRRRIEPIKEEVMVRTPEGIAIRALPVHWQSRVKGTLVGFEIEQIENGKQEWQRLCYVPSW